MVLSFKTQINGKPTHFREKILVHLGEDAISAYYKRRAELYQEAVPAGLACWDKPKKLTIRDDPHFRWRPGLKIHFATGARTKDYECFAIGECTKVADLFFHFYEDYSFSMKLDGKGNFSNEELNQLAIDDGFDSWEDFCDFHMPEGKDGAPFYPPNGWMRKRVIYF